jgi:tetratricopeptide (TPR) repeat protein
MGKKTLIALLTFIFLSAAFLPAQTAPAESVERILSHIAALLSEYKYNEAVALFDTIPPPEGNSSRIKLLKASALSSARKYSEARTVTEAVIKAEPNNIDALFTLAAIEGATGRQRLQRTALEKIIKIAPDNTEALVGLGNLSLQSRNVKSAASYFDRVLSKDSANADALLGLARAYRMNREWEGAEVLLNRAVSLYPDMAEARSERARFYLGRSFLVQALEDLDEAKRLAPGDYWISIDRANLLLELNRREQALEEFNRAITINPDEYTAYAYTSGLKDDFGDFDGAEHDYAILAKLKPDYFYGLEGLGLHKMRRGNWAEAAAAFAEAYKQAPRENLYALLAAICQMRLGDISAPRQFLQQVQTKVKRDTLEWYMFRLYYDLTVRNYVGETDMLIRLDGEQNKDLKTRMMFYMAQYYDIRGNITTANKYYLLVSETDNRAIPEWRLNDWIMTDRNLKPF